jgi:tRNA-specific 2-thiouridylase
VPDQDYAGFLKRYRGHDGTAGDFVDLAGNVLGHHEGYEHFTVGQRKGLGIAFGEPRFVVRINPENRQVVLGLREDLATKSIRVHQVNWLADRPGDNFRCEVKVRYRQASEGCLVQVEEGDRATIIPDVPIMGVAPGQAAVLYNGDQVLGGGWIL